MFFRSFLGIAHRDLKPENILCTTMDSVSPVKLCDLDLASKVSVHCQQLNSITTPELQSPVRVTFFPFVFICFVEDKRRECD